MLFFYNVDHMWSRCKLLAMRSFHREEEDIRFAQIGYCYK